MSGPRTSLTEYTVWLPWRPGPAIDPKRGCVISVTDFRAHRRRDLPGIYSTGLRLREGWYAMPGAIGLWLWGQPFDRGRGGSISVWESEADLRRFVALPAHRAIMRKYRNLGTLRADTWHMDAVSPPEVRRAAEQRLAQFD